MKKRYFCIILVIFIAIICSMVYKNNAIKTMDAVILQTLNGYENNDVNVSEKIDKWSEMYLNTTFYPEDYKVELLDDVNSFINLVPVMRDATMFIEEDPFNNLETVDRFNTVEMDKYFKYFSKTNDVFDSRVFEENNKYYIYVKDLDFNTSTSETIYYGDFYIYLSKDMFEKETLSQRQLANRFESLGYYKEDNSVFFKYFDKEEKETVTIEVKYFYSFFVEYCKIV